MWATAFTGWKWVGIPLLVLVGLVVCLFLVSILYFVYAKYVRRPDALLTENLDKEEAMPPRAHS